MSRSFSCRQVSRACEYELVVCRSDTDDRRSVCSLAHHSCVAMSTVLNYSSKRSVLPILRGGKYPLTLTTTSLPFKRLPAKLPLAHRIHNSARGGLRGWPVRGDPVRGDPGRGTGSGSKSRAKRFQIMPCRLLDKVNGRPLIIGRNI